MRVNRKAVVVLGLVVVLLGLGAGLMTQLHGFASSGSSATATTVTGGFPSQGHGAPSGGSGTPAETGTGVSATELGKVVPAQGPDIIETGSMAVSVRKGHLLSAFDAVTSDAESEGGYVADSSSASQDSQAPTASLVVRVPSERFTPLVMEIATLGKVDSQQQQGQDVTGQLVNLSARISNLQAEQLALRNLVERAGSIPNILQVQNELFSVESEIEQLSAQQASLENQTAYATLTVDLAVRPLAPVARPRAENTFARGAKLAWHNLAVGGRAIVLGIGWAFPLLIVAGLGYVVWRLKRRRGATTPSPAGS